MREKPGILVIDDEPVVLDSARRILEAEGFPVAVAGDAESALRSLQAQPADIVISDLMLPGISGIEFMEEAHRHDPNLVVIITTGYSTLENGVASLRKGAFDFLPKPFTFEELLSPVARAARYLELSLAERLELPAAEGPGGYVLGKESWARAQADGSALLGFTQLFLRTSGAIETIEFPLVDAELQQGGRLARCVTADKLVHDVWSPLSGRVLEVNEGVERSPDFALDAPQATRWLVRVLPSDFEKEVLNLTSP